LESVAPAPPDAAYRSPDSALLEPKSVAPAPPDAVYRRPDIALVEPRSAVPAPPDEAHRRPDSALVEPGGVAPAPPDEAHRRPDSALVEPGSVVPAPPDEAHRRPDSALVEPGSVVPAPPDEAHRRPGSALVEAGSAVPDPPDRALRGPDSALADPGLVLSVPPDTARRGPDLATAASGSRVSASPGAAYRGPVSAAAMSGHVDRVPPSRAYRAPDTAAPSGGGGPEPRAVWVRDAGGALGAVDAVQTPPQVGPPPVGGADHRSDPPPVAPEPLRSDPADARGPRDGPAPTADVESVPVRTDPPGVRVDVGPDPARRIAGGRRVPDTSPPDVRWWPDTKERPAGDGVGGPEDSGRARTRPEDGGAGLHGRSRPAGVPARGPRPSGAGARDRGGPPDTGDSDSARVEEPPPSSGVRRWWIDDPPPKPDRDRGLRRASRAVGRDLGGGRALADPDSGAHPFAAPLAAPGSEPARAEGPRGGRDVGRVRWGELPQRPGEGRGDPGLVPDPPDHESVTCAATNGGSDPLVDPPDGRRDGPVGPRGEPIDVTGSSGAPDGGPPDRGARDPSGPVRADAPAPARGDPEAPTEDAQPPHRVGWAPSGGPDGPTPSTAPGSGAEIRPTHGRRGQSPPELAAGTGRDRRPPPRPWPVAEQRLTEGPPNRGGPNEAGPLVGGPRDGIRDRVAWMLTRSFRAFTHQDWGEWGAPMDRADDRVGVAGVLPDAPPLLCVAGGDEMSQHSQPPPAGGDDGGRPPPPPPERPPQRGIATGPPAEVTARIVREMHAAAQSVARARELPPWPPDREQMLLWRVAAEMRAAARSASRAPDVRTLWTSAGRDLARRVETLLGAIGGAPVSPRPPKRPPRRRPPWETPRPRWMDPRPTSPSDERSQTDWMSCWSAPDDRRLEDPHRRATQSWRSADGRVDQQSGVTIPSYSRMHRGPPPHGTRLSTGPPRPAPSARSQGPPCPSERVAQGPPSRWTRLGQGPPHSRRLSQGPPSGCWQRLPQGPPRRHASRALGGDATWFAHHARPRGDRGGGDGASDDGASAMGARPSPKAQSPPVG